MFLSCSSSIGFDNRYLPTILLLRHFDVFRNLGSRESSPNEQVGVASEVASVIRKFTEPVNEDEDINSKGEPIDDCVSCNYLLCHFLALIRHLSYFYVV